MIHQICLIFPSGFCLFCVFLFETDSDEQFGYIYVIWNKRYTHKNVMKLFGLHVVLCVTWPLIQNKGMSFGFITPAKNSNIYKMKQSKKQSLIRKMKSKSRNGHKNDKHLQDKCCSE